MKFLRLQHSYSSSSYSDPVADLACGYVETIASLLSYCAYQRHFRAGTSLHAAIIKTQTFITTTTRPRHSLVLWNSLLSMYSKLRDLPSASMVFADMPRHDTVSFNTILSSHPSPLTFFKLMHSSRTHPLNSATFTTLLSSPLSSPSLTSSLHSLSFPTGFHHHTTFSNSLITSYFLHGLPHSSLRVFHELPHKNVVSWTSMISGFAPINTNNTNTSTSVSSSLMFFSGMRREGVVPNLATYLSALRACSRGGALEEGRQIQGHTIKLGLWADMWVESTAMDMYAKCGSMEGALRVMEKAERVDEVSITVMVRGLGRGGMGEEARRVFRKAVRAGVEVDETMVAAVLVVLTEEGEGGREMHGLVVKKGLGRSVLVCNGLVSMYGKCGELVEARGVFESVEEERRNIVSWNSMIGACCRGGDGRGAVGVYEEMVRRGVRPTGVTFVSLLQACSHGGLVEEGVRLLGEMRGVYGMEPEGEHYACVVDMVGRAGLVEEAGWLAESSSTSNSSNRGRRVWEALMGVCGLHAEREVGRRAAEELQRITPESDVPFVAMGRICWEGDEEEGGRCWGLRRMKEKGLKKEVGVSRIQVDREVHSFVVGNYQFHPRFLDIHRLLILLLWVMKKKDCGGVDDHHHTFQY